MAEHANSTPAPTAAAAHDDFDRALCDANTITGIIDHLADHQMTGGVMPAPSHFAWLAEELYQRLERIEVAEMTMRSARA